MVGRKPKLERNLKIVKEFESGEKSAIRLAEEYGISRQTIYDIIMRTKKRVSDLSTV